MVRKTCKHLFALKFKPCMLYQATDVGLSITCMCFQGYVINSVIIYSIFIEVYLFFFSLCLQFKWTMGKYVFNCKWCKASWEKEFTANKHKAMCCVCNKVINMWSFSCCHLVWIDLQIELSCQEPRKNQLENEEGSCDHFLTGISLMWCGSTLCKSSQVNKYLSRINWSLL